MRRPAADQGRVAHARVAAREGAAVAASRRGRARLKAGMGSAVPCPPSTSREPRTAAPTSYTTELAPVRPMPLALRSLPGRSAGAVDGGVRCKPGLGPCKPSLLPPGRSKAARACQRVTVTVCEPAHRISSCWLDGSGCRLTSSILDVARNSDGEYRWPSRVAQTSLYSRALLDSELRSHSTSFWRKPADLVRLRCRMRLWLR